MNERLPKRAKNTVAVPKAMETVLKALSGEEVPREDLREALRHCPDMACVMGDWGALAEASIVGIATDHPAIQESISSSLEATRERLAQQGDSELELLLVRRVALASLALDVAEMYRASKWQGGITSAQADFWDRHVSRLQSEFLRACRSLAVVRKLRRPSLVAQVNIAGQQQVNVVGRAKTTK